MARDQTFYSEYLERLQDLHKDIQKAIDGLPPQALDWVPGPEMNSVAVLVVHLCGAERYWIGDVAGGEISGRERAAEFQTSGLDLAALKARLAGADGYAASVLERLSLADLEAVRTSPRDGRQFTVAWALLHALEHTAIHLGHLQLARQMWQERQGAA
jgi:uncharacterized damage-inducible protein DinB